jgi:hypothetical protein
MSGSKTRPGFSGGDEPPPSNPEEALSPRATRTVMGHAIHLHVPADPGPAARVPSSPREEAPAGVPETVTDETTEEFPPRSRHSGKTKLPAFARLFGRWTTGGGFRLRSRMSGADDDTLNVPREVWVSRLAIFVLAALLSFLVALAILKLHGGGSSVSRPSAATQAPATSDLPTPPSAGTASADEPAPAAREDPPATVLPAATDPVAPSARPPGVRPQATHRPAKRAGSSSARAVPGATLKLPAHPSRTPHPPTPAARDTDADSLLPLRM